MRRTLLMFTGLSAVTLGTMTGCIYERTVYRAPPARVVHVVPPPPPPRVVVVKPPPPPPPRVVVVRPPPPPPPVIVYQDRQPPLRVEVIPPRPHGRAVWAPGHWNRRGHREWIWVSGCWR